MKDRFRSLGLVACFANSLPMGSRLTGPGRQIEGIIAIHVGDGVAVLETYIGWRQRGYYSQRGIQCYYRRIM